MGFTGDHPWTVGLAAVAVCLALFTFYYFRRQHANSRVKDDAALVFTDLAQRLGGRYQPGDQSPTSVYAHAGLGRIAGRTMTLIYEVRCYPRGFEDIGGRLQCTVLPAPEGGVFDVPSETARWSSLTSKRQDSVGALFGRRYAERTRDDLHPAVVALAKKSFEVQISPEFIKASAPPEAFDWPKRLDNEAASDWVNALLELADTFPRRRT